MSTFGARDVRLSRIGMSAIFAGEAVAVVASAMLEGAESVELEAAD